MDQLENKPSFTHHFPGVQVGMLWADNGSCWLNLSKVATALLPHCPAGTAALSSVPCCRPMGLL